MLDTVEINHVQHISFTQSRLTDAVSVILSEILSYEHPSKTQGVFLLRAAAFRTARTIKRFPAAGRSARRPLPEGASSWQTRLRSRSRACRGRVQWSVRMRTFCAPLRGTNSSRSLQRSFASSPVSASTIRLRRSSLGSLIMAAAFCESKYWGFMGNVLSSFRLLSAPRARAAARGGFVFSVSFVGGCGRAACGASGGKGALAVFSGAAARFPGARRRAQVSSCMHTPHTSL